jgi:catechol 2,3-dioxygenase-like lactoylglutathione lyase family enzyme
MRLRRTLAIALTLTLSLGLFALTSPATPPTRQPLVRAVDGVSIAVENMERAVEFYGRVLFFEKLSDDQVSGEPIDRLYGIPGLRLRVVRMRLGDEHLDLVEPLTPRGRHVPADSRSHDRWFQHVAIIVNDIDQVHLWLRRHRVQPVSREPQRLPDWNANAAGIRAFYFKDPDGHVLEILQFPPDKGDPRWHRPSSSVFLGIDHTAIVVSNTEASLAFYRDKLGMRVTGHSENYGPEQERLNNIPNAHLRITTLRAPAGPAIEFLEYLTPRDGRSFPPDARANDLTHWQTKLTVTTAAEARAALRGRLDAQSLAIVPLQRSGERPQQAFAVTDPDGHALLVKER